MFNKKTYLVAKCNKCSKTWNISVFQQIPNSGYLCPYCKGKAKRQQRKNKSNFTRDTSQTINKAKENALHTL